MTCEHMREELDLLVGQPELPSHITSHLEVCADCRKYFGELQAISEHMQDHSYFGLNEDESSDLLAGINEAIGPRPTIVTSLRWLRYAAAAAVVTISVSIGYYELRKGVPSETQPSTDSTPAIVSDSLNVVDSLSLSSEDIEQLMQEYTSDVSVTTDPNVLENLSDEELKYVEKNLNVGDLL